MNTDSGIPGHSINEGYPFNEVVTEKNFPNRVICTQDKSGKIFVNWSSDVFGKPETEDAMKDFLINRLFDYSEALKICEDQVRSLLDEMPFIPEEFGFEVVHKPDSIHDSPIRMYQSKLNPDYTLFREPGDTLSDDWDPTAWVLMKKEGNEFRQTPVFLPCHRIAYALFYALGIKIKEDKKNEISQVSTEENDFYQHEGQVSKPEVSAPEVATIASENLFDVVYNRPGQYKPVTIPQVSATDEKDAMSKAKFLIETGEGADGHVVDFKNLIATKTQV